MDVLPKNWAIGQRGAATLRACVAVVTHDPRSRDLFDRIVDLDDGRIVRD